MRSACGRGCRCANWPESDRERPSALLGNTQTMRCWPRRRGAAAAARSAMGAALMRRNATTGDITYSPQDILLFRESPFAAWMERLTLENPDHGIAPDSQHPALERAAWCIDGHRGATAPGRAVLKDHQARGMAWDEFIAAAGTPAVAQEHPAPAEALQVASEDVVSIAAHASEKQRSAATLTAMQQGAVCIANAQLTVGPLSASVDLLLRGTGVSDLGSYLYLPCDTRGHLRHHCAFHLACAADLLSTLQGALPAQLLVLREGEPLDTLRTEDHIVLYRTVRKRFMAAQLGFRKHCMPDPAESSHFGRWTRCAQDILKHRAAAARAASDAAAAHSLELTIGLAS